MLSKIFVFTILAVWTVKVGCNDIETMELLNWEPPEQLKRMYPYYLAGVDKEGSPVWVIEFGRWNLRATMEKGGQIVEDFKRYTLQMIQRWHHSPSNFSTETNYDPKYVLIADLEGYNNAQLLHFPSVQKYLEIVTQFVESQRDFRSLKHEYIINTNVLFLTLFSISRPLLAPLMQYIDLYSENAETWTKVLRNKIDLDQLPIFYGGYSDKWKPMKIYGR